MASIVNKVYHKQIKRSYDWSFVGAKLQLNGCYGNKDWRSYLPFKHQGHILGWFSNRTGTSFDAWKARENDLTLLPVPNLSLCHWSSKLFDLRAPSSTDVPVLLLNQPTNSPDRPPYISLKNLPREFDKRAKHFPFGDHFVYSHNFFSWLYFDIVRRILKLVTSKTSKVNRVAPWLRITLFFSIFPLIKILHRKIRDVKGCNMVYSLIRHGKRSPLAMPVQYFMC